MNVTMHPGQRFHHGHLYERHDTKVQMQHLVQDDAVWLIVLMFLAVVAIIAALLGTTVSPVS